MQAAALQKHARSQVEELPGPGLNPRFGPMTFSLMVFGPMTFSQSK